MPDTQPTDGLLDLYSLFTQDITFCKQQQWSVTNYALVLDAAIVGIAQLLKDGLPTKVILGVGCVCVGIVMIGTLYVLCSLQRSIDIARVRISRVKKRLPKHLCDVLQRHPSGRLGRDTRQKARDRRAVLCLLRVAIVGGAAVTIAVIFRILLWPKPSVTPSSFFLPS